jgi:hypothetical protein
MSSQTPGAPHTSDSNDVASTFSSSKIIRFTVAAGIIVLGLTAIILAAKVS